MSSSIVFGLVLFVYILILFIIGLVSKKRMGKGTEDFYLGGRTTGAWVSSFSFVAAYFSSVVIIGGGGFGYKFGMATIWIGAINVLVGATLAWIVLGKRTRELTHKLNAVTMPEFLGKRYKSPAMQIFSAIIIVIFMVVYNVSILKAMANVFQVLMSMTYFQGLLISGVIIIIYVTLGGYLAVVWTSFFQAWIMLFGLILLTVVTLVKVGGFSNAMVQLSTINQNLVHTPGIWGWSGLISYAMIVSFGVWGMPQLLTRFYSIRNVNVLRIGTVLATIGASMALLPYFNGAIARILFPSLNQADLAIPNLVKTVLPTLGQAVFLTGVIAAGMSTFAAVLIICISSLIKDLYEDGLKQKLDSKTHLRYARLASIAIGILSLIVAIKPPAMILVLTAFSWAVIASANLWPFFFGLYLKTPSKNAGLMSMIGGACIALVWLILRNPFGIHGFIPGIVGSLIIFIIVNIVSKAIDKTEINGIVKY
jgi:SSS family solute:Na+ symporter